MLGTSIAFQLPSITKKGEQAITTLSPTTSILSNFSMAYGEWLDIMIEAFHGRYVSDNELQGLFRCV